MRALPLAFSLRVLLVLMVALLTGCTLGAPPAPISATPPEEAATPTLPNGDAPPALVKRGLSLNLSVADAWVRPNGAILASAAAPEGASVGWFLALRNPYVPGDDDNVDLVPRTLDEIAPGGAAAAVRMSHPGRYAYATAKDPATTFNVTVVSSLGADATAAVLAVDEGAGLRFAPSELVVGVGADVVVENRAARAVNIVRVLQMLRAAPDGGNATIMAPNLQGDYDVVAIARDGADGWGEAYQRVIVDRSKPDENVTLGPWTGSFHASSPLEPAREHAFESKYDYRALTFTFEASSAAPGDVSVRARLVAANGTRLASAEGVSGKIDAAGLLNGSYAVQVELVSGVEVSYRVMGAGTWRLVPPASFFNS